ncbi:MAG: SsrA-binding protein SmpB [bacterium]|nr:SsrA-binding protein SmpB [bacterium]
MKTLSTNKKAYFNYEVLEEILAGMKLEGREIKSLRNQKPSFAGSFVTIVQGKPILNDLNIPRYRYDASPDYSPKRKRLILMKKSEIERIEGKMKEKGVTLVPLEILLDRQWAKIRIGLVRGKKQYDKRQVIKDREEKRSMKRILKRY